MQRFRRWFTFVAIIVIIGGGMWLWWNFDLRWRPRTIAKNQAQIARILDGAGWVSPHPPGPKLYMIAYRSCPDSIRFEKEALPKRQAAGVDTRVIMIARADKNGLVRSTAPERATVAELWLNRDWGCSSAGSRSPRRMPGAPQDSRPPMATPPAPPLSRPAAKPSKTSSPCSGPTGSI